MLCLWFTCLPKSHFHVLILQQEQHHMGHSNSQGSAQGWSQCRACILNKLCHNCNNQKRWNQGNRNRVFNCHPPALLSTHCLWPPPGGDLHYPGAEGRSGDWKICGFCSLSLFKQSSLKVSQLLHWTQFVVKNSHFFVFLLLFIAVPCACSDGLST